MISDIICLCHILLGSEWQWSLPTRSAQTFACVTLFPCIVQPLITDMHYLASRAAVWVWFQGHGMGLDHVLIFNHLQIPLHRFIWDHRHCRLQIHLDVSADFMPIKHSWRAVSTHPSSHPHSLQIILYTVDLHAAGKDVIEVSYTCCSVAEILFIHLTPPCKFPLTTSAGLPEQKRWRRP